MWNIKKYAAMATVGVGLAFAATPASAWGVYGYGGYGLASYGCGGCGHGLAAYGGCGAYGYRPTYGYGGCGVTVCIAPIELTRIIPDITIINQLTLTRGVGISCASATAIL